MAAEPSTASAAEERNDLTSSLDQILGDTAATLMIAVIMSKVAETERSPLAASLAFLSLLRESEDGLEKRPGREAWEDVGSSRNLTTVFSTEPVGHCILIGRQSVRASSRAEAGVCRPPP